VHDDARAGESARAVAARAYTVGEHVVFAPGAYAPATGEGKALLAHELAHVAQQRAAPGPAILRRADGAPVPSWSAQELRQIQGGLQRLGLYQPKPTGTLDAATQSGLVEAFGDESWRTMSAADVTARLAAADKPQGTAGEHRLRYGELFKDGVLDVTLSVGFDETKHNWKAFDDVVKVLTDRRYVEDAAAVDEVYKQAGRSVSAKTSYGRFFVKKNAFWYTPPAADVFDSRFVHVVVRLVTSLMGLQGAKAAGAVKEGMVESDVSFYTGHGRYGTGPDFDPHTAVERLDDQGNVTERIEDYNVLELQMKEEGKQAGRGPWSHFLHLFNRKRLRLVRPEIGTPEEPVSWKQDRGTTGGNVRLTPANPQATAFGRKLLDWAMDRDKVPVVTGKKGELATSAAARPERKYRVLVFDGCNTTSYVQAIRGTPGYGSTAATDILGTKDEIDWGTEAVALGSFLDGVVRQQSAEQILENMDNRRGVYKGFGLEDNPVVPK
jgi:uncharacterized protein DUF4157